MHLTHTVRFDVNNDCNEHAGISVVLFETAYWVTQDSLHNVSFTISEISKRAKDELTSNCHSAV
ncbi:hypothetical protein M513_08023 [Trichuris suis]|uniref:Uncharacterized protein n=1 Tax=Trichuris suis TaxID=68888 RepID=A0A085M1M7_9BILA|nr:hypothetical protein M513_08023 [Trichuris suis]